MELNVSCLSYTDKFRNYRKVGTGTVPVMVKHVSVKVNILRRSEL
jgi:hypothetical protein